MNTQGYHPAKWQVKKSELNNAIVSKIAGKGITMDEPDNQEIRLCEKILCSFSGGEGVIFD